MDYSFGSSLERVALSYQHERRLRDAPNMHQRGAVLSAAPTFVARQQTRAAVRQGFIAERELRKPFKRLPDPSLSRGRTVVALRALSDRRLARRKMAHLSNTQVLHHFRLNPSLLPDSKGFTFFFV